MESPSMLLAFLSVADFNSVYCIYLVIRKWLSGSHPNEKWGEVGQVAVVFATLSAIYFAKNMHPIICVCQLHVFTMLTT